MRVRELLRALKEELVFWEQGGYGRRFRGEWRPTLVIRDSPLCLNATGGAARSCRECLLFDLIPPEKRNLSIPCHHIALNQADDTIASLYANGTQEKLDETFHSWLCATIQRFEGREVTTMKALECTTAISFKNILFLTDFSPASEAAFSHAVALARHFDARVYPAHVVVPYIPNEMDAAIVPDVLQQAEEQGRSKLTNLFERTEVNYQALVNQGMIEDIVPTWIKVHGIDLIVMGTHGRKGADRFFLGSTAEAIFRTATCPVLTVGPHVSAQPLNGLDIKKVLFATSLNKENDPAASYALSFAREQAADLKVLHVLPTPPPETQKDWDSMAEIARGVMQELVPSVEDWPHKTEFVVDAGDAAHRIVEYSYKFKPGLIVMGVSEKNMPSTHFRRGVAYKVISSAPCAVLTVR